MSLGLVSPSWWLSPEPVRVAAVKLIAHVEQAGVINIHYISQYKESSAHHINRGQNDAMAQPPVGIGKQGCHDCE